MKARRGHAGQLLGRAGGGWPAPRGHQGGLQQSRARKSAIAAPAGNCVFTGATIPACVRWTHHQLRARHAGPPHLFQPVRANVGTSFSAPLAAATAGLMKAVNPATDACAAVSPESTARTFPTISDTVSAAPGLRFAHRYADAGLRMHLQYAVCGAGMLDCRGGGQRRAAPAVLAQVTRHRRREPHADARRCQQRRGHQAQYCTGYLDGGQSLTGGASTPTIQSANQAHAPRWSRRHRAASRCASRHRQSRQQRFARRSRSRAAVAQHHSAAAHHRQVVVAAPSP